MEKSQPALLRNIGIAAHIDAGKTTLTERILFYAGRTHRMGEVHEGTTIMDYLSEERERGITITAAATQASWPYREKEHTINIIDTPGHVDFTVEVERSLRVCDGLVVLLSAVEGVEPQSETVWRQADRYSIPRLVFVNKMDLPGAYYEDVLYQIQKRLKARPLSLQLPIGEAETFQGVIDLVEEKALIWEGEEYRKAEIPDDLVDAATVARQGMVETLAELDDDLLEKFLEAPDTIIREDLYRVIRKATLQRQIVPVFCGTAYRNKGVQPILDAICAYLPSPEDVGAVEGSVPGKEEKVERPLKEDAPFAALVFKIALDEQHRKMAFFRVYSGKARRGQALLNPRTGEREKLTNLYQLHGGKHNSIWEIGAGDIAGFSGGKDLMTGDTLCDEKNPILLDTIPFPEPVIAMVVEARSSRDLDRMYEVLRLLEEEDPSFTMQEDEESGRTIIQGMGELHLEVIAHRLRDDFKLEVNLGRPTVNYKEQLSTTTRQTYTFEREMGEPLYAELEFELGPADDDFLESMEFQTGQTRLQFELGPELESVKPEYIEAVRSGFASMVHVGPLAGFELHSLKVRLTGHKQNSDSNQLAFEICAREAFRKVALYAGPMLVEPIMALEVNCPEEFNSKVLGDLNRRRGIPRGVTTRLGNTIIKATVPLAEMFGYANEVRTLTSGRALVNMTFSHYAPVPENLAAEILDDRRGLGWGTKS